MTIMDSFVILYGVWTDYQYIILSNFGLPWGPRIWWDMKWKKGNFNFDSILVMIMEWQWVQTPYSRTFEPMMVKKIARLRQAAIAINVLHAIHFIICIALYELHFVHCISFCWLHYIHCILCNASFILGFMHRLLCIYSLYSID